MAWLQRKARPPARKQRERTLAVIIAAVKRPAATLAAILESRALVLSSAATETPAVLHYTYTIVMPHRRKPSPGVYARGSIRDRHRGLQRGKR